MEGHGRRQPESGWFRPRSGRVDVLNVVVGFGSAFYRRREPNGTDDGADLGYVAFGSDGVPETKTTIKREQCRALASFTRSGGIRPSRDEMIAVHVLTHESMHMSGIGSEVASECRAMQRDARMARLLGAGRSDARYLASWYWRTVYPHMTPAYRSDDCGPGQALDEGLPDPPWEVAEEPS